MKRKLLDLIRSASCDLSPDAEQALRDASEEHGSRAASTLVRILENVGLARNKSVPICQDTGTLTFFFHLPDGTKVLPLKAAAEEAVREATEHGWLRNNTIETLSGRSIDDNVAVGAPVLHFEFWDKPFGEAVLLMKGGGSENMSRQYSLPDPALGSGRDLQGVRRCILDAAVQAQGQGCAPGILGVCIGGDRAEGFASAKRQLLRSLEDESSDPVLAKLEKTLVPEINSLGIGPMGTGGNTTVLGVKMAVLPRVPASYFVTVAYLCWAARRKTVRFSPEELCTGT